MNLKEAIDLIDPEIEKELRFFEILKRDIKQDRKLGKTSLALFINLFQGRLSQMKREVLNLDSIYEMKINESYENEKIFRSYIKRIEALNILINHLEEVLK